MFFPNIYFFNLSFSKDWSPPLTYLSLVSESSLVRGTRLPRACLSFLYIFLSSHTCQVRINLASCKKKKKMEGYPICSDMFLSLAPMPSMHHSSRLRRQRSALSPNLRELFEDYIRGEAEVTKPTKTESTWPGASSRFRDRFTSRNLFDVTHWPNSSDPCASSATPMSWISRILFPSPRYLETSSHP